MNQLKSLTAQIFGHHNTQSQKQVFDGALPDFDRILRTLTKIDVNPTRESLTSSMRIIDSVIRLKHVLTLVGDFAIALEQADGDPILKAVGEATLTFHFS